MRSHDTVRMLSALWQAATVMQLLYSVFYRFEILLCLEKLEDSHRVHPTSTTGYATYRTLMKHALNIREASDD